MGKNIFKFENDNNNTNENNSKVRNINFRIDFLLWEEIKNFISSAKNRGNFNYPNVADFTRQALKAYKNGDIIIDFAELKSLRIKSYLVKMDDETEKFYDSLPEKNKMRITESCLRAYLVKAAKS